MKNKGVRNLLLLIEIIKSIILGIVQGISEWLPISSTGHMILVEEFIQFNLDRAFIDMFFVVIQLASIFAVILLYFNRLNPIDKDKTIEERNHTIDIWKKVIVGIIPAGVFGVLFNDIITDLFFNSFVVALMLIIYGIAFIVVENRNKGRATKINSWSGLTYRAAFIIGWFQVLSLIPGTSRSGATIIGAILIGTARPVAAEFSFFMSIPIMFGASLLSLFDFGFTSFTGTEIAVLIAGCITSFVVSYYAIKYFMRYIQNNDFKPFGWYRIGLGIVVLGYFYLLG